MTWLWIRTDIVPLTPEVASDIAELPHFEGDRPWDSPEGQKRMQWLSRLVDEEKFYPPRWATASFDGKTYRVNGGTSSHMLILRDSFPSNLQVIIDRFSCETLDDVADLFDQFDHRKSIRTMIQKVRAHRAVESSLAEVSPTSINVCATGIACALGDFQRLDEDQRIQLIHRESHFIVWASPFAKKRHLSASGQMAAIYLTHKKDPIYARGFWEEVADGSNPDHTHPTRVLGEFLKEQCQTGVGSKKFTAKEICAKCIHAWNAARNGGKTALKMYNRESLPAIK
jgi:hypothetical protein